MNASPSTHLGAPQLFRNAGYEGVDDFTAIATFISGTSLVAVHPSLPVHSIAELIAYARANPGRLNYGSAGAGGSNHMLGVLFMQLTGTEFTHVPYRGGAPALADLIAGNIQLVFDGYAALIPAVRAGQIRALAVTSPTRWPLAPEFPTLEELGVVGFDLPSFNALMGPRGIPDPIVQRMNAVINEGLRDPRMVERLTAMGSIPFASTPAEFAALMRAQRQRWQALVRSTGLQPE
jgi:tripartite-type tricarboxylate transporter receptor subunit TctC